MLSALCCWQFLLSIPPGEEPTGELVKVLVSIAAAVVCVSVNERQSPHLRKLSDFCQFLRLGHASEGAAFRCCALGGATQPSDLRKRNWRRGRALSISAVEAREVSDSPVSGFPSEETGRKSPFSVSGDSFRVR